MKNFELLENGNLLNTETQEEFINLFSDEEPKRDEETGELDIDINELSHADGIDFYTPQGRQELSKIERAFSADGTGTPAQSWHIYDPSEEDDDVLKYVDEDGTEKEWNFSALQRRKVRQKMLKEIGRTDGTPKGRATLNRWIGYCNNGNDANAGELLRLYRDSKGEMTLMMLYDCLDYRGKYYEVYK